MRRSVEVMSSKREQSITVRAIGYFLSGLAVYVLLNQFSLGLNFDNLIRTVFVDLIIFAVWESISNRWLWKTGLYRSLLGIRTPFVRGRWEGYIKSSYDDFASQLPIVLEIEQSSRSIELNYYDANSIAKDLLSDFTAHEGSSPRLICVYRNEPTELKYEKFQIHYGTLILTFDEKRTELNGVYFNYYQERPTYGEIHAVLKNRKLLHCFEKKTGN
jgi:hypothetical protein